MAAITDGAQAHVVGVKSPSVPVGIIDNLGSDPQDLMIAPVTAPNPCELQVGGEPVAEPCGNAATEEARATEMRAVAKSIVMWFGECFVL